MLEYYSFCPQKYNNNDFSYKLKPNTSIGRMLMIHLLKANSSQGESGKLKLMIDESRLINVETLFKSCCLELGLNVSLNIKYQTKKSMMNYLHQFLLWWSKWRGRKKSLKKLSNFMVQHEKYIDLECHLPSQSGPF